MISPAPNYFDRAKPFYPLVMNYMVQLVGFKELSIRGVTGPPTFANVVSQIPAIRNAASGMEADVAAVCNNLRKIMGPLELRSEFLDTTIVVDVDEIARELVSHHNYVTSQLMRSASSLLILAHETNITMPWNDHGPLWEFLRHCRHGAAHRGRFHFLNGEPKRRAVWGRLKISKELEGTSVFKFGEDSGLLSPGDPIRLLWDIEEAYPDMTAFDEGEGGKA